MTNSEHRLVGAASFRLGEIGEPFELGRHISRGPRTALGQRVVTSGFPDAVWVFDHLSTLVHDPVSFLNATTDRPTSFPRALSS